MKKYYVKINGNVFGPYEEKNLHSMFNKNQLSSESLVKRSGDAQFIALSHFIKSANEKTEVFHHQSNTSEEKQAFPYQVNSDATASHLFTSNMSGNPVKDSIQSIKDYFASFTYYKILFLPFILVACFFLAKVLYFKSSFQVNKPNFMKYSSFQKFEKDLKTHFQNKDHVWKFLVSTDLKKTWVGSSLPGHHLARIKFQSIPYKILSHVPVKAHTETKLYKNNKEIKEWIFEKGEKFHPGFYKVQVTLLKRDLSMWDKLFLPEFEIKKTYETKLLIGSSSKKVFMKDLKGFLKKSVTMNFSEIQEIEMKYQTLNSITKQIASSINEMKIPKSSKKLKEIRSKFISKYQKEFGSFFTNFVIENNQIYQKKNAITHKKSPFTKHYKTMSKIAAEIGKISADTISQLKSKSPSKNKLQSSVKLYESVMKSTNKQLSTLDKFKKL